MERNYIEEYSYEFTTEQFDFLLEMMGRLELLAKEAQEGEYIESNLANHFRDRISILSELYDNGEYWESDREILKDERYRYIEYYKVLKK